jgi:mycothiol synthase
MTLGRSDFDPELLFVMEDEKDVVGVAYCIEDRGTWWVQQLAVRASHRGRGLGRALLQQAFHRAGQRGLHRVGLSTDSRTGALGLYERVGMHVMRTYTHYAKPL